MHGTAQLRDSAGRDLVEALPRLLDVQLLCHACSTDRNRIAFAPKRRMRSNGRVDAPRAMNRNDDLQIPRATGANDGAGRVSLLQKAISSSSSGR